MKEISDEDYEVIPMGPIRRLEERIKKVESEKEGVAFQSFFREILDLVKSNQGLVDEIVKANDELRNELSKIPPKIDEVITSWKEFIELLKRTGGAETTSTGLSDKFDKLIEQNKEIVDAIESLKPRISRSSEYGSARRYPTIKIKR